MIRGEINVKAYASRPGISHYVHNASAQDVEHVRPVVRVFSQVTKCPLNAFHVHIVLDTVHEWDIDQRQFSGLKQHAVGAYVAEAKAKRLLARAHANRPRRNVGIARSSTTCSL